MRSWTFMCFVAAGLVLWPACRGGSASATELPPPQNDDRPPGSPPELPRLEVELPPERTAPAARVLSEGDDLEEAIEDAKPGDVIALTPGAIFKGAIRLPNKSGSDWITIRTATPDEVFPARGKRVSPAQARLMAVIESNADFAIHTAPGAHHYRFIGIEFRPKPRTFVYNLIELGNDARAIEDVPHHIIFERCYIHGDAHVGGRRGIALNSAHTAIIDSYIADFKESGADSQAVCGWNGPGPFVIENNYLEGAGENVMFGGSDPDIKNLVPSDITITGNHFSKPLTWKTEHPHFAGTEWTVKNLFELKNARRVLVEANVFENHWSHAQAGFAIVLTPRNQDGGSPWSMVRDVTFTRNVVRNSAAGFNILGTDDIHPSQQTKRILIRDNLFERIGGPEWNGSGRLFQILTGVADLVIEHNTALQTGDIISAEGDPHSGFVFRNNLTLHNDYGVGGRDTYGNPMQTLARYFPDAVFLNNVLIGAGEHQYPPGNFLASTVSDIGFVDFPRGDYRLSDASPYKAAGTDGKDIGADLRSTDTPSSRRRAARNN